jgi:hypothetical protein
MAEYAELNLEMEDDIFQPTKDVSKDSKCWITRDREIKKIKELETSHLKNIDKMFGVMFWRLLRVKLELVKRKIFRKS